MVGLGFKKGFYWLFQLKSKPMISSPYNTIKLNLGASYAKRKVSMTELHQNIVLEVLGLWYYNKYKCALPLVAELFAI